MNVNLDNVWRSWPVPDLRQLCQDDGNMNQKRWKVLFALHLILFREGNGTPLQNSRLENPMDGGAW